MKKISLIMMVCFCFSCSGEEDNTPAAPIADDFDPAQATLLKQGMMTGVGHSVSGTVKIYDDAGKKVVVFEPFSSQNGPDLKVYLSTDRNATEYINLGSLKSTMGKQSYDVTATLDLSKHKFVLIWCQKFSVLFGEAEMQ